MVVVPDPLFFHACADGDAVRVRAFLDADPSLAHAVAAGNPHGGWTALHEAARHGRTEVVRLLLERGADPNAREAGDNTYPLHWAAARGDLDTMQALIDAGGDVHGAGADHAHDVIGWATLFTGPGKDVRRVADFLVERGARHHIFSALCVGDADLVRSVVAADPSALNDRLSRWEHGVTPLQFAIVKEHDDLVALLTELGADLEATDIHGQTALVGALALGNTAAAQRLRAAGAKMPATLTSDEFRASVAALSKTVKHMTPMIGVRDVAAAIAWYTAIGFTEGGRVAEGDVVNWAIVSFGDADLMLTRRDDVEREGPVSLWFYSDRVEELYGLFKARQMDAAVAALERRTASARAIEFVQELWDPPYGGREFGVKDPNGYQVYFRRG